jgi:hypothetical protein
MRTQGQNGLGKNEKSQLYLLRPVLEHSCGIGHEINQKSLLTRIQGQQDISQGLEL